MGEILDPIADKLLAFCALVALAWAGRVPVWLPALVVGRDAVIVSGAFLLQAMGVAQRYGPDPADVRKVALEEPPGNLPLDDRMSEKIFDRYLKSLDAERLFFTQATFAEFPDQIGRAHV